MQKRGRMVRCSQTSVSAESYDVVSSSWQRSTAAQSQSLQRTRPPRYNVYGCREFGIDRDRVSESQMTDRTFRCVACGTFYVYVCMMLRGRLTGVNLGWQARELCVNSLSSLKCLEDDDQGQSKGHPAAECSRIGVVSERPRLRLRSTWRW